VWHILLIALLKNHLLWMPTYLFGFAIVLPVTLIVSYVSYSLIELPFLALRSVYRPATVQIPTADNVSSLPAARRSI
jgi:peptidoglycan/LPS O-acetylase OafA/YrhL